MAFPPTSLPRALAAGLALAFGLLTAALPAAAQTAAPAAKAGPRTLTWEDLMPADWDPMKPLRGQQLAAIAEGGAKEKALMSQMRAIWDQAPTRAELDGQEVRLPGYVVPIEREGEKVKEYLLVPYFGACIHSPPPPANQIVHVILSSAKALRSMDTVWAVGTLKTARQDSPFGMTGYALERASVSAYKPDAR